jgi:hypothetical protein
MLGSLERSMRNRLGHSGGTAMRVLIGCEFSGAVRRAIEAKLKEKNCD